MACKMERILHINNCVNSQCYGVEIMKMVHAVNLLGFMSRHTVLEYEGVKS